MKFFKEIATLFIICFLFLPTAFVQAGQAPSQSFEPNRSSKVVNGTKPVNMKNWGFIARVYDNESSCTGMLIDQYWVLTAAHCVNDDNGRVRNEDGFRVVIGKKDTSVSKEIFAVGDIFSHPFYSNNDSINNDIALVKLKRPAKNKPIVRLPLNNDNDSPGIGKIAGYGKTCSEEKPMCTNARFLFEGKMQIRRTSFCDNVFDVSRNRQIICATPTKPFYSVTCYGDSGGPLIVNKKGRPLAIGVLSMSNANSVGPCNRQSVKAYTSTAKYIKWISHYVNRDVSISSTKVQMRGMEDPKKRITTVTIKNKSKKWHLSMNRLMVTGAGRYCVRKYFVTWVTKSLKAKPCGVTQSLVGDDMRHSYSSYEDGRTAQKSTFSVIKNNCPIFNPPGGYTSIDQFMELVAIGRFAALKPEQTCQLKIKIYGPSVLFKLDLKNGKGQIDHSDAFPLPGAQLLEVQVDPGYPGNPFNDVALIQSCVDNVPLPNTRLVNKKFRAPYSNCAKDLATLRNDPAGIYYLKKCGATSEPNGTIWSEKCYRLWLKAKSKYD